MATEQLELLDLKNRIGEEMLSKRLRQQVDISTTLFSEGFGHFHWENLEFIPRLLKSILKTFGIFELGTNNSLDFRIEEVLTSFNNLPVAFEDYRILHLSDLHLDGMPDAGEALRQILLGLEYDLCVMTGDFRFSKIDDYAETMNRMALLMDSLKCTDGCFGVLGNHDFIEKVPGFEKLGLRMLLNESIEIERDSAIIQLAGIDDSHFYGTQDIKRSCAKAPSSRFSILLAHSPESARDAAAEQINLYLCGHTHGGQICLPGGVPILTNSSTKRRFSRGSWQLGDMQGYTSRGTGTSSLAVRYCCPPEITIHRLKRMTASPLSQ